MFGDILLALYIEISLISRSKKKKSFFFIRVFKVIEGILRNQIFGDISITLFIGI